MATLALTISRAPGWRELRSFAFVAISAAAYCFFDLVHVVPVSSSTIQIGEGFALASAFFYGLAWIRHLAIVARKPLGRIERGALVIATGMAVLAVIPGVLLGPPLRTAHVAWFGATYTTGTATPFGMVCIGLLLIAVFAAAFGGGRRWRDGWPARMPMLGAVALALAGVSDVLSYEQIIAMPALIEAVTVVVVGVMGAAYARRFIADAGRLEALSTKLEQEVATRTAELLKAQAIAAHHERLAGLGRIAAGVAHEINNPTMVIQQSLDRMRTLIVDSAALTPELDTRLERSRAATQHIADIARQLLESGRRPPVDNANATAFSVAAVIAKAIAAASVIAPALSIKVTVAETLAARGAPQLLEQVLLNLLLNAAHATKDSPGGGRAHIVAERRDGRVRVTLTDNGPGIAEVVRDRLFEPFSTTKPVGQGTGLGLAVSRSLMTQQGGDVFVATSSSAGTEMALELPAADAIDAPAIAVPELPRAASPNGQTDLRVLIIDDNEDIRELLSLQLDRYFQVDAAPTVDHALSMVANRPRYDAVLCDLMMPRGGAESWLQRCTEVDPRLDERTILLTAGPTTTAATELVEVRREKVLFKPVNIADLRPMIERIARA